MRNYKELLPEINTFIFDYDGVLTNGTVILLPDGEPHRTANVKDGYALQLAVKKNYNVAVISGGRSKSIMYRMQSLNIQDIFIGVENKLEAFQSYLKTKNIQAANVLYMGDDIPDILPMQEVAVAACPADASEEVKSISHYISHKNGGDGCVRDVIEQVLKSQRMWMNNDAHHW